MDRVMNYLLLSGKQVGRHMFLSAICSNCRKADRRHFGSEEPKKDGRRRSLRQAKLLQQRL